MLLLLLLALVFLLLLLLRGMAVLTFVPLLLFPLLCLLRHAFCLLVPVLQRRCLRSLHCSAVLLATIVEKRVQVGCRPTQLLLCRLRPRLRPHWLALCHAAGRPCRPPRRLPPPWRRGLGGTELQRGMWGGRAGEPGDPGGLPRRA